MSHTYSEITSRGKLSLMTGCLFSLAWVPWLGLLGQARFGICDDNSKQVIMESWNTSLTSLTSLRYSINMESASSTESPVVGAKDISLV